MIFDYRKKVFYSQNREPLRLMGMEFQKGVRPHYEKYKNHENEFVVWFNYEAIKNADGKYENPSDNEYINIYSDDCDYIEEIIPEDKKIDQENNSLFVLVFKKLEKGALYFCGVYVLDHIEGRKVFFYRISTTFDTDNVYRITPTDNYYFYLENMDNHSYAFKETFK